MNLEPISLNLEPDEITLNLDNNQGSIAGVELLANNKVSSSKMEKVTSIDTLENELNDLVIDEEPMPIQDVPKENKGFLGGLFGGNENKNENKNVTHSWDGYSKLETVVEPQVSEMPKTDVLKEKFKYLKLLEELEKKGVTLSKKYDMESSLLEMQGEYETLIEEKEKHNSIKFQGKMLMAMITGMEFLNSKFDPFDVKLDGWGEQVNENINEYDEIFKELHDKYKSKGKMAPEIKLLFQLAGSGIMIHMTNTMFKSSMPGMDDIMRQNPDLMNQFTQAAVNQMSRDNPGFGSFMNMAKPDNVHMSRPDINFAKDESRRPEMKGPDDISELLAGLKQRDGDDIEKISVNDYKEENNNNLPKKSRRRNKSETSNTVSLNL